jgi:HPr kinase/phosphorylase
MPLRPTPKAIESLSVDAFFKHAQDILKLSVTAGGNGMQRLIRDKSINRPALALTGYFKNFAAKRVQLFGAGEMAYLRDLPHERQVEILRQIIARNIPCMVVSRNLAPTRAMQEIAEATQTPILRSTLTSRDVSNGIALILEHEFAPRVAEHGTLMDIRGIGTLIRGRSGVGKSECALALIERGHSLVADDLVYIRLVNDQDELQGRSSDLNRGYMECRGLGILNIAELFGIRAVRLEKNINLVVTFEEWHAGINEERTGLEQDHFTILGVSVPHIRLPVRPGRDLARLVEVASMVQALKMMGHDSAKEFNDRLIRFMAENPTG